MLCSVYKWALVGAVVTVLTCGVGSNPTTGSKMGTCAEAWANEYLAGCQCLRGIEDNEHEASHITSMCIVS